MAQKAKLYLNSLVLKLRLNLQSYLMRCTHFTILCIVAKRKPVSKKGGPGRNSKMSGIRDSHDSQVTQRMLSARRLKINELRNKVEELSQQLYNVERENKLLKRQNVIKDRVIDKHEGDDSEVSRDSKYVNLPPIMVHSEKCSNLQKYNRPHMTTDD